MSLLKSNETIILFVPVRVGLTISSRQTLRVQVALALADADIMLDNGTPFFPCQLGPSFFSSRLRLLLQRNRMGRSFQFQHTHRPSQLIRRHAVDIGIGFVKVHHMCQHSATRLLYTGVPNDG